MKVKWKAVTGLHLSGWDKEEGFLITFHSADGKNFGIIVCESDVKGFADTFAEIERKYNAQPAKAKVCGVCLGTKVIGIACNDPMCDCPYGKHGTKLCPSCEEQQ